MKNPAYWMFVKVAVMREKIVEFKTQRNPMHYTYTQLSTDFLQSCTASRLKRVTRAENDQFSDNYKGF